MPSSFEKLTRELMKSNKGRASYIAAIEIVDSLNLDGINQILKIYPEDRTVH